jgi:uncharacterized protein (TIGR01244 family)
MSAAKRINLSFSAGGQPDSEEIQQLAAEGFKTIVNLRSANEAGALSDEQQQAATAGLNYINVPLSPTESNDDLTAKLLAELNTLPKPVFFHCGAGARAGALALIALTTQEKLSREQVIAKAQELDISPEQPHLKSFLEKL